MKTRPFLRTFVLTLVLCSLALPGDGQAQGTRDLTPLDVVLMKSVTGAFPSPDGSLMAFTRSDPRPPEHGPGAGYSDLYLLDEAGAERPLAAGRRSIGGVAWDPRGTRITFLESREGDPGRQLYALSPAGGEPQRVFLAPRGISQYRWRPGGGAVAFTAALPAPSDRAAAREAGFRQAVVDEDWTHLGLFLWEEASGTIREFRLPGSVFEMEWSADGSRMVLTVAPRPLVDDSYMFKRLHLLDVATGEVRLLVDNPGKLGDFALSPDGAFLAYVGGADRRDPHAGMLYLAEVATGEVTELTPGWEGMVHSLSWLDPLRLRLVISRGVESRVSDFHVTSRSFSDFPGGDFAFVSAQTAGQTMTAVVSGPLHPGELYSFSGGSWHRRTDSNPWLAEVALTRQEAHSFLASDGLEIEGILLYPAGFRDGVRYPMVIVAHGGPEAHFNNSWLTSYGNWGQLLSRKGYFVWFPNYRASTGRGVAFAKADHGDIMGGEFQDHLDAIHHFVELGWVDRSRVGIGGGSYGGYTAAWAATRHTDHFAAAVSFVPITHVATKWLTSDIPWEFYLVHYEEMWPHEQWDYLEERSPLTYAHQSRTPLLLAGGTVDTRVHPSQPHMLFRAVKETTETPVRYVQYPGEGHGNRNNVYQYDYLLRALRWFDTYLAPGDRRRDPPPPLDVDYGEWLRRR
jgi:dipeptidyl aminopeptidase/acylaminoacyl peptidase